MELRYIWPEILKLLLMKRTALLLFLFATLSSQAQSPWPGENWSSATPLTTVMNSAGLLELSGLHWNPLNNRLYVVHGDGRLRVMQLDIPSHTFSQIGNKSISGGPEGITQADFAANEFYTIDENNYEIRKYTHTTNFTTVTETKHWNLLQSPSPMVDTGNTGPEGIIFVPDTNLASAGFVSSVTQQPYTSVKGAGGLFFVAHQDGGYVWVFDVNPNVNNDFTYVGKYKTNRNESCDLSFDRSTGLLYILHNLSSNYIELTDLSLAQVSETKFATVSEYFVANPADGNTNIEGFAVMPKCESAVTGSAFLCRDVESNANAAIKLDAIRWFEPYLADGICEPLDVGHFIKSDLVVYPNPISNQFVVKMNSNGVKKITVYNSLGQKIWSEFTDGLETPIDAHSWPSGNYILSVESDGNTTTQKILKN